MPPDWVWPVLLGVLGGVFGSFIATVAVRWPQGRSALKGRSMCDGCGRTLRAGELVPLVSYAMARGRCSACGAAIRPEHPAAELAGLAIGVLAGWAAPGLEGVAGAVFGWMLLLLMLLDLAALWLPNLLTGALAVLGLATGLAGLAPALTDRLIGGAAGFGALWLVASAYRLLRGRQGLGGGDPKLFGAIGLWLGWHALPFVLLGASLTGLVAVASLQIAGRGLKMDAKLPFGVFLGVAAWGVWLAMMLTGEG